MKSRGDPPWPCGYDAWLPSGLVCNGFLEIKKHILLENVKISFHFIFDVLIKKRDFMNNTIFVVPDILIELDVTDLI